MYLHTKKEIGSIIKSLRLSHDHTQGDLAYYLGTTQQTVARWESGESQPDLDTFFHICDIYQIHDVLHTFGYGASMYPSFDSKVLLNHPYFRLLDEFCISHKKDIQPVFDYFFSAEHMGSLRYIFSRGTPNLVDEIAVANMLQLGSHTAIYLWGQDRGLWSPDVKLSPEEKEFILKHRELSKSEFSAG